MIILKATLLLSPPQCRRSHPTSKQTNITASTFLLSLSLSLSLLLLRVSEVVGSRSLESREKVF